MDFLLRIKHWQLFLIMIAPLILEVIAFSIIGFTFWAKGRSDLSEMPVVAIFFAALFVISLIVAAVIIFAWIYTIVTRLHQKLPAGHTLKLGRFKFALFYPVAYLAIACLIFVAVLLTVAVQRSDPPGWIFLIVPFHFLAIYCMFYVYYFTAKSLKSVELQRQAHFADYVGEFFLMWFYFIGVWFIQPRINDIFANEPSQAPDGPLDRYVK